MRSDIIISVENRYINIEMKKVSEKLDELSNDENMIDLYDAERHDQNVDVNLIVKVTGLIKEEIESLK